MSGDIVRDLSKYLKVASNVHFWAIEVGLFDAWGGKNDNVTTFKTNLQIIVDSCKAHSIQPVISTIPATQGSHHSPSMWQVHNDFLKAVDSVVKKNKLTTDGRCISSTVFKNAGTFTRTAVPGCYTVRFESTGRIESVPVVVY